MKPSDLSSIMEAAAPPLLHSSNASPMYGSLTNTAAHRYDGMTSSGYVVGAGYSSGASSTTPPPMTRSYSNPNRHSSANMTFSHMPTEYAHRAGALSYDPGQYIRRKQHEHHMSDDVHATLRAHSRSRERAHEISGMMEEDRRRALELAREVERERLSVREEQQERILEKERQLEELKVERMKAAEAERKRLAEEEERRKEEMHRRELERIREREKLRESQRSQDTDKRERQNEIERSMRESRDREERLLAEIRRMDNDMGKRLAELELHRTAEQQRLHNELEMERNARAELQTKLTGALTRIEEVVNTSVAPGNFTRAMNQSLDFTARSSGGPPLLQDAELQKVQSELQAEQRQRQNVEDELRRERRKVEELESTREDPRPWKDKVRSLEDALADRDRELKRCKADLDDAEYKCKAMKRQMDFSQQQQQATSLFSPSGQQSFVDDDRVRRLEDDLARVTRDREKAVREVRDRVDEIEQLRGQIDHLTKQVEKERAEMQRVRVSDVDARSRRERELEDEMDSLRRKNTRDLDDVQRKHREQVVQLEDELLRVKKEKEVAVGDVERKLSVKSSEADDVRASLQRQLQEAMEASSKEKEKRIKTEADLSTFIDACRRDKDDYNADISKLKDAVVNAESKALQAQKDLEALQTTMKADAAKNKTAVDETQKANDRVVSDLKSKLLAMEGSLSAVTAKNDHAQHLLGLISNETDSRFNVYSDLVESLVSVGASAISAVRTEYDLGHHDLKKARKKYHEKISNLNDDVEKLREQIVRFGQTPVCAPRGDTAATPRHATPGSATPQPATPTTGNNNQLTQPATTTAPTQAAPAAPTTAQSVPTPAPVAAQAPTTAPAAPTTAQATPTTAQAAQATQAAPMPAQVPAT
eukprot:PhM_4_TR10598/c1_g1_i2/m.67669